MNYLKSSNILSKISSTIDLLRYNKKLMYSSWSTDWAPKLEVGQTVSVVRNISDEDANIFAKLTDDFNPIHISKPQKIVHGALLNGFLSGVLGTKLPGPGAIVTHQLLNYPKPCYVGDTIEIKVTVVAARKIIRCDYKIVANSERIVLEGEGKFVFRNID